MKKYLSRAEVIARMKREQGKRSNVEFARLLGISGTNLCEIYRGTRQPGSAVLAYLGLQKLVLYQPAS